MTETKTEVSIHNCLLFAEEFLKLAQFSKPNTSDPFIQMIADIVGARELRISGEAIQPAFMEFLGREFTNEERANFKFGLTETLEFEDFNKPCSAFILAHLVWHIINDKWGKC